MKKGYTPLAVTLDTTDRTATVAMMATITGLCTMLYDIGGYDGRTVFNSCLNNSRITKGSAFRR